MKAEIVGLRIKVSFESCIVKMSTRSPDCWRNHDKKLDYKYQ